MSENKYRFVPRAGGPMRRCDRGFTLLELLVVLFLVALILGLSAFFFTGVLSSSRLNATAREMSASIKYARALAQTRGETQVMTIDLDTKRYGIGHHGSKDIPAGIDIRVLDPFYGDVRRGLYHVLFHAIGGMDGGTIVLWNNRKTLNIKLDPILGPVMEKS